MPDIDTIVVCIHLTIDHSVKIVCQRKHKVGKEKSATIDEEVQKLTSIGFIIEVKYPSWMANVVFVTKESNKWHMCIDITDLNITCLKEILFLT